MDSTTLQLRADRRAQRRFHAMFEARGEHGWDSPEAARYHEAERLIDRLREVDCRPNASGTACRVCGLSASVDDIDSTIAAVLTALRGAGLVDEDPELAARAEALGCQVDLCAEYGAHDEPHWAGFVL